MDKWRCLNVFVLASFIGILIILLYTFIQFENGFILVGEPNVFIRRIEEIFFISLITSSVLLIWKNDREINKENED